VAEVPWGGRGRNLYRKRCEPLSWLISTALRFRCSSGLSHTLLVPAPLFPPEGEAGQHCRRASGAKLRPFPPPLFALWRGRGDEIGKLMLRAGWGILSTYIYTVWCWGNENVSTQGIEENVFCSKSKSRESRKTVFFFSFSFKKGRAKCR
jgi:hypothetical protein